MTSTAAEQSPVLLAKDLLAEIPQMEYKQPIRNKFGGFVGYVNKPGSFQRYCFQATAEHENKCTAPFAISERYDDSRADDGKRNFELTINSPDLMEFLKALDENTLNQAISNYDAWFNSGEKKKRTLTPDEIRSMYRTLVQESTDESKGYPPRFRTKVNITGPNALRVFVFKGNVNGKPSCVKGKLEDITKFMEVVPIVEIGSMWFMSKEFGLTLNTTDVVLFPKIVRPSGCFNFGGVVPEIVDGTAISDDQLMEDVIPSEELAASHSLDQTQS